MAMYHDAPKPPVAAPAPAGAHEVPPRRHRWALVLAVAVVPVIVASWPGGLFDRMDLGWAATIGQLLGLTGAVRAAWLLASHVPTTFGGLPLALGALCGALVGGGFALWAFWEGLLDDLFGHRGLGVAGWGSVAGASPDTFYPLLLLFSTMLWLAFATWWARR